MKLLAAMLLALTLAGAAFAAESDGNDFMPKDTHTIALDGGGAD